MNDVFFLFIYLTTGEGGGAWTWTLRKLLCNSKLDFVQWFWKSESGEPNGAVYTLKRSVDISKIQEHWARKFQLMIF